MKKRIRLLLLLFLVGSLALGAAASEAVGPMIEALPTVEEFAAMNKGQQNEAYNQTQQAYDAYMALREEEKALLPEAEAKFEALFTYFNEQIMTLREEESVSGKRSVNLAAWIVIAAMAAVLLVQGIFRKKHRRG